MATRELISVLMFNVQAIYIRGLWTPETKDMAGKPLEKPSYYATFRVPKTRAHWAQEPAFADFAGGAQKIWQTAFGANPAVQFPVKDGDLPNRKGVVPEWAKGHWHLRPTSSFKPDVRMLGEGGATLELPAAELPGGFKWTDGDFVTAALAIGPRADGQLGVKAYLNAVLFTGKGAAVQVGAPSVDWSSAIQQAQQRGITLETARPQTIPTAAGAAALNNPFAAGSPPLSAGSQMAGAPGLLPGAGAPAATFPQQGGFVPMQHQPGAAFAANTGFTPGATNVAGGFAPPNSGGMAPMNNPFAVAG